MPFLPSSIFDIAVMEADDIAGNDGDAIGTWAKQSGTISSSAVQPTVGERPLLKKGANGLNSKNILLFDGSDDFLSFGDVAELDFGTNPFSVFFVILNTNGVGGAGLPLSKDIDAGTTNGLYFYFNGQTLNYFNGSVAIAISTTMDGSTYHLVGVTRAGTGAGGLVPYFDGTAQTAGVESRTMSNALEAIIGAAADPTSYCPCRIAAIYIGSSVPSTANRNAFSGYIQTKYGLTIAGATFDTGTVIEVQTTVTNVP